jgi:hypothetical protein
VELFPITLSNKSIILIKGKGTIILSTTPELKIQLNNILYSPQFRNILLLLIPKIIQARGSINFSTRKAHIINNGITIVTGIYKLFAGLY